MRCPSNGLVNWDGNLSYYPVRAYSARGFVRAVKVVFGKYDNPNNPGELSYFRALTSVLSATIGKGNIVGVAAAILMGGPGVVFWMWITACVGMATKFKGCTLAVHFRRIDGRGEVHIVKLTRDYFQKSLSRNQWKIT